MKWAKRLTITISACGVLGTAARNIFIDERPKQLLMRSGVLALRPFGCLSTIPFNFPYIISSSNIIRFAWFIYHNLLMLAEEVTTKCNNLKGIWREQSSYPTPTYIIYPLTLTINYLKLLLEQQLQQQQITTNLAHSTGWCIYYIIFRN